MSTPTAGPDDRSPTLSDTRLRQIEGGMRVFVSWLRDAENCTLTADSAESMFADLLSALRSARRDVARLTEALQEIANGSTDPDDWQPYDEFNDPVDADITNSGDMREHGYRVASWQAAKIARVALNGAPLPERKPASVEELREAWEAYSDVATVTDGHTRACSYRYAVNSKAEPCNCGYARVERTIRLLIGNAPVSSPPILEKNDRG